MNSISRKKTEIVLFSVLFFLCLGSLCSFAWGNETPFHDRKNGSKGSSSRIHKPNQEKPGVLPKGFASFESFIAGTRDDHPKGPFAYLVVRVDLLPDFHLYSMNQKEGGYPTKFNILSVNFPEQKGILRYDRFIRVHPSVDYVPFQGNTLEELKGSIEWFVPLFLDSERRISPEDRSAILKDLNISVEMDALACLDGNNGACFRIDYSFEAQYNPQFQMAPLLEKAEETAKKDRQGRIPHFPKSKISDETKNTSGARQSFSFSILFWAFLGGLILNVMPCVLPVIGLKIISFFEQSGQNRSRALWLNIWYTAGILIVFGSLALMSVGLSYLFTYGLFQIIMGTIVFAMSLNLMGIWELRLPGFLGGKKSNELMQKEGAGGAIFKGIITTLLAIPCGAPLLSPVLVWADSMIQQGQTPFVFFVYMIIGLGMASPYLLIGAFPELLRFLPKPGYWMETFRNIMGFVLLGAVIWILFSMPVELILSMVALLFAIWFVCWWIGRIPFDTKFLKRVKAWSVALIVLSVVLIGGFNIPGLTHSWTLQNAMKNKLDRWAIRAHREGNLEQDHWRLFDPVLFEKERKNGKPIIVDFTADWCMNCKVLESTVLHAEDLLEVIERDDILTFTADWTNQNDRSEEMKMINALLDQYGGRQVPTVMLFNFESKDDPVVYRGLFSKKTLLDVLNKYKVQK